MRLYVGNLQWGVTEQDLTDYFSKVGNVVQVRVVREQDTQRSRGFGFVTMLDRGEGERAIRELDNSELRGRPLKVSEARERPPRARY